MSYPESYILGHRKLNPLVSWALDFKHLIYQRIEARLPKEQAGLAISLISGEKNFMSKGAADSFNLIGAAHIIAVSGYKLTLVMIALDMLIPWIGRRKTLAISLLFMTFYAIMSNFAAAVMRSVIMSSLFVVCRVSGRKYYLLPALILTAAILVALNPLILIYDVGFVLSFTGILGIIYFAPLFNRLLHRVPEFLNLKEMFIASSAAQIATIPIMILYFHQLAAIAPLSNFVLLPLLAPSIVLTYFTALPVAGWIFAQITFFITAWMLAAANFMVNLRYSHFDISISSRALIMIYAAEIVIYFALKAALKKTQNPDKMS